MGVIFDIISASRRVTPIKVLSIDSGSDHALAIRNDKTNWAWGWNFDGRIGDNTTTNRKTPVYIGGSTKTFSKISGATLHSLAIDKNGMVWGWGSNGNGRIGDNTNTQRNTPVSVVGTTKTFCEISAGTNHSMAIDKNGMVWCWGAGGSGQLGNNATAQQRTPVSVVGATKTFCKISNGNAFSVSIDKNGGVWGWGLNSNGQLGNNTITSRLTPVAIAGATKTFCRISAGDAFTLAIDKNGRAWAWGANVSGQLGDNTTTAKCTPVSVVGAAKTFCKISAGTTHSLAIDKNGRAWGWGVNSGGQIGDNTFTQRNTPVSIAGTTKTFCEITAGSDISLAIDKWGKVWSWGNLKAGLGINYDTLTPISVAGSTKTFCQIGAGSANTTHSLAIDKNGIVWAWGLNGNGQLGDNTTTSRLTPVSVVGATKTFCQISGGETFSMGLDKNGRAWSWGLNTNGRLGDGTTTSRRTPVSVAGATKTFCQISSGFSFGLAIDKNGRAWSWGSNASGQLGDNTTASKCTPVSVVGATKTFCQINANSASFHSMAIDKNGRIWAWGANGNGQLGDNSVTQRNTPVSILGATKTFCKINVGEFHSTAIDKNGRIWAWGLNSSGQLGDNTTASKRTPVSVVGATKTFCQISVGRTHSLAIDKNGIVWAWGINTSGRLGDGTLNQRLTPVSIAGATKTFCQIRAGNNFSLGVDKNGRVWAWGDSLGLGLGVGFMSNTPIQITTI